MSTSEGFLQLVPRGVNHRATKEKPASKDQVAEIDKLRDDFLSLCMLKSDHPLRNHERLLNKLAFIDNWGDHVSLDILEAILCDRATLFSPEYAHRLQNHQIARETRSKLGKTTREQHESAMEWLISFFPQDKAEQAAKIRSALIALDAYARDQRKSPIILAEELNQVYRQADSNTDSHQILNLLQKWTPEISLDLTEVELFQRCLNAYARHIHEQKLLEKITGHYKASYSDKQFQAAMIYRTQLEQLQRLRELAQSEHPPKDFPFENEDFGGGTIAKALALEEIAKLEEKALLAEKDVQALHAAMEQYFSSTRTTAKIDPEKVNVIVFQTLKERRTLFPFRFLVLCIVGGGMLFSSMPELSSTVLKQFPNHVYRAKPSREKQRLARMIFMAKLCQLMHLNESDCLKNWHLFWWYHGRYIETTQEAAEWIRITDKMDNPPPTATYSAQCFAHIEECLSSSPETLFSYNLCSKWHLGGFLQLVQDHSDLAPILCKAAIPPSVRCEYLALWSQSLRDRERIRELCKSQIKNVNWSKIKEIINDPMILDSDELRSLLTEYAIRLKLVNDAKKKLKKDLLVHFDKLF